MSSEEDLNHLRLLSIFHYVFAGILALVALFPILHLIIGILFVSGVMDQLDDGGNSPPAFVGWFFIIVPAGMILFGWAVAITVAIAGRRLSQRRNHTFCLIVAAALCLFMPMGTVLGVFTIIVLMRSSVQTLFGCNPEPSSVPNDLAP